VTSGEKAVGSHGSSWAKEMESEELDTLQKLKRIQGKINGGESAMAEDVLKGMIDTLVDLMTHESKKNKILESQISGLKLEADRERKRADHLDSQISHLNAEASTNANKLKHVETELDELKKKMVELQTDRTRVLVSASNRQLLGKRIPEKLSPKEVSEALVKELELGPESIPRIVRLKSSPMMVDKLRERGLENVGAPCLLEWKDESQKSIFLGKLRQMKENSPCKTWVYEQSFPKELRPICNPLLRRSWEVRQESPGTRTLIRFSHDMKPFIVAKKKGESKYTKI